MRMTDKSIVSALAELEVSKLSFGKSDADIRRTLSIFSRSHLDGADTLIRLHESLLFLRAYPPSAEVLTQIEQILKHFGERVSQLRNADTDLSPLDDPEVSGIAGTT